jgi:dihydrolipoamide dehydrogenase
MEFDVLVIGAGPGGYVSAIRCAQLGFSTALVEKDPTLGGTCLNVGCIPSKALLDSSEHYYNAVHAFAEHGIDVEPPKINWPQMMARKKQVVDTTCSGIDFLMNKNKVTVLKGLGSFVDAHTVMVSGAEELTVKAKHIIVATGSTPIELPFAKFDGERIISSTEALSLPEVPKRLVVIGGGVIGLELGSVYKRLGADVTVVEFADSILATMDGSIGKEMQRVLRKTGMTFHLGTKVEGVERHGDVVKVKATDKKGNAVELEGDYCLVAVGRKANTAGLNYQAAGITADDRGRLDVNDHLQTSQPHIYAIGDVVRGAMLAHKAEEEGVVVAEQIAGQKPHLDYNLVPGIVYTWPEAASVGQTEEQLKASGRGYKVGNFPMRALGRSRASGDTDGFVKVLADASTDEVLGAHIVGARAADLIMELAVAMEYRASAEDVARICHGHPTYTEAIKEAALDATAKRAIHM